MKHYDVEMIGEGRGVYGVEAESEDEARTLVENGEAGHPWVTEVSGGEVTSVRESA